MMTIRGGKEASSSVWLQSVIGSDSEDENDYSLFDEASFEERKRSKQKEENDS